MAIVLRMPEVMANQTEAVLARWSVREGESVAVGDTLAEIETEKALVDLPADEGGVVGRLLVDEGSTVTVGTPIAVLTEPGETDVAIDAALSSVLAPPRAVTPVATVAPVASDAAGEVGIEETTPDERSATTTTTTTPDENPDGGRRFSSPLARRLAREGGLDVATLTGTGPGGRVVRRDVERSLANKRGGRGPAIGESSAGALSPSAEYDAIAHTPMRRAIARRLTESTTTVPHFYLSAECRVDALLALRATINGATTPKVSVNDLVVKAVAAAFVEVPDANVTWSDDELRRWHHVDVGIAIATNGGLVTPIVRRAETLSLVELRRAIADLAERARQRTLRQSELEGGSFSVSNLGMYGTREFAAILNPPQSGILAVGAAYDTTVVVDGDVRVATVMRCTLSVDHRALDGALAATWLAAFVAKIENPITLLL